MLCTISEESKKGVLTPTPEHISQEIEYGHHEPAKGVNSDAVHLSIQKVIILSGLEHISFPRTGETILDAAVNTLHKSTPLDYIKQHAITNEDTVKQAADILASYRNVLEKPDGKQPSIPQRSTSMSSLTKRKRYDDAVAFHRNSCQLFASLDGTLAQSRQFSTPSSSSSSSSSSIFSTCSSTTRAKTSRSSTRNTSLDNDAMDVCSQPDMVNDTKIKKPKPNRPSLPRMTCTVQPKFDYSSTNTDMGSMPTAGRSPTTDNFTPRSSPSISTTSSFYAGPNIDSIANPLPTKTTTIHWTSPQTRQREYAKIDAANSGFRLFLRRIIPCSLGMMIGGSRQGFWDEKPDENDARSVRRFRMSISDNDRPVEKSREGRENTTSDLNDFGLVSNEKEVLQRIDSDSSIVTTTASRSHRQAGVREDGAGGKVSKGLGLKKSWFNRMSILKS